MPAARIFKLCPAECGTGVVGGVVSVITVPVGEADNEVPLYQVRCNACLCRGPARTDEVWAISVWNAMPRSPL